MTTPSFPQPPSRAELADAVWEGRLSPAEAAQLDPSLLVVVEALGMTPEEAGRRINLDAFADDSDEPVLMAEAGSPDLPDYDYPGDAVSDAGADTAAGLD